MKTIPLPTDRLSGLIGLIYDAAIDPARWPIAIEEIRIALGSRSASLNLQALPSGEVLIKIESNIPIGQARDMVSYNAEVFKVWGGQAVLQALPMRQPPVTSKASLESLQLGTGNNRYSLELGKPQGWSGVIIPGQAQETGMLGSLSFGRHESDEPIGEKEIELAGLLIRHFRRAAKMNRLLKMAVLAGSAFEAVIDTLAAPVFLTTADLRIVHANPAGYEIAARGDLLTIRNGVLAPFSDIVSSGLKAAVAQALTDRSGIEHKCLGVPVRPEDGPVGTLRVLPLRPGRIAFETVAIAAIFLAQAHTPLDAPTELITALFGLTPAEARVFERIVAGGTVAEISAALDVKQSTVRTHLVRIFEKTETQRQSELIQLAISLAGPFS